MSSEIEKLRKEVLLIARETCCFICTVEYNMNLRFFKGEELDSYTKLWKNRLANAKKEISASTTVKSAFDKLAKFDNELIDYIKAEKVDTADKAMEIAHSFIKKYSPVALPMKAEKKGDVWLVDIDVGALAVKIAKVKVDARTGDIESYEIPSKASEESK